MPVKIMTETQVEFSEYFSKYGFGDGDDSHAVEIGFSYRDEAIRELRKALVARGMPMVIVIEFDRSGMHNPCLIEFRKDDVYLAVDPDDRERSNKALAEKGIDAALFWQAYEEVATEWEARVAKNQNGQLV